MRSEAWTAALGVISGSTLDGARELWKRARHASGSEVVAVNGQYPSARVFGGRIVRFEESGANREPLTKAGLRRALSTADYLTFTGHGSSGYWRLDDTTRFVSDDVPPLPPVVIGTASCQTFRIWNDNSIARRFTDQGASAYAGFVYSPIEGYLIGEFEGLPFRYTWPGFTVGEVLRVQNRGASQGFAQFSYYHLLGDPRMSLHEEEPFPATSDLAEEKKRVLTYGDVPEGVIPLRIPDGAEYHFVRIPGQTAAWVRGPFYNARLQMVDSRGDKLLLVVHRGGDLTVELYHATPLAWLTTDILGDALDHTLIYSQNNGGEVIGLVVACVVLLVSVWLWRRGPKSTRILGLTVTSAIFFALLYTVYAISRLPHVDVTSKQVVFSPLTVLTVFLLTGCGAFLFCRARTVLGRATAVLIAVLPIAAQTAFSLGFIWTLNTFGFKPRLGSSLYNLAMALMPAVALVVVGTALVAAFSLLRLSVYLPRPNRYVVRSPR